jgi:hypothetical protein
VFEDDKRAPDLGVESSYGREKAAQDSDQARSRLDKLRCSLDCHVLLTPPSIGVVALGPAGRIRR